MRNTRYISAAIRTLRVGAKVTPIYQSRSRVAGGPKIRWYSLDCVRTVSEIGRQFITLNITGSTTKTQRRVTRRTLATQYDWEGRPNPKEYYFTHPRRTAATKSRKRAKRAHPPGTPTAPSVSYGRAKRTPFPPIWAKIQELEARYQATENKLSRAVNRLTYLEKELGVTHQEG